MPICSLLRRLANNARGTIPHSRHADNARGGVPPLRRWGALRTEPPLRMTGYAAKVQHR